MSILYAEWQFVCSRIEDRLMWLRTHPALTPPLVAQRLLVSAEDWRHGCHSGFDVRAIIRAGVHRLISFRREGASTIEQQIVRVVTNRFERKWRRKVREILLASLVASRFPKSATPALYLAIGYYGWRMNNYLQACRRLGLCPNDMSLDDAAALVARLKYPEPRIPPPRRLAQISSRKEYLKRLYGQHLLDGKYLHLGVEKHGEAISRRGELKEALEYVS